MTLNILPKIRYMTRVCERCGVEMKNVFQNTRYCEACRERVRKESRSNAYRIHRDRSGYKPHERFWTKEENAILIRYCRNHNYKTEQIHKEIPNRTIQAINGKIRRMRQEGLIRPRMMEMKYDESKCVRYKRWTKEEDEAILRIYNLERWPIIVLYNYMQGQRTRIAIRGRVRELKLKGILKTE